MKNPSCFQVTKTAIMGMAQYLLISHDGSGASGPRTVLTSPVSPNMNSQTVTIATLAVTYGA